MDRKPPRVGTVGDQIALRHEIWMHCDKCRRRAKIDIAAVAAKYGNDFKMQWLVERAVCSSCSARWPDLDLTISPMTPTEAFGKGAH